jgi:predicted TIM-barrel fold metal-dependent hydrolase
MVLGGVFENHPELRFGVIELGAYWIGPLCDTLDFWYNQDPGDLHFSHRKKPTLTMAPSRYIKRNVRVAPYDGEKVSDYIRKYGLEDVLCFATDYPHAEGGKDPAGVWYADLQPLGEEIVEKFFVGNGAWLLPD